MIRRFAAFALFALLSAAPLAAEPEQPDAATQNAETIVPGSKIQPAKLLNYTYQRWQAVTAAQYGCANSTVLGADSYSLAFDGAIKERWQARVCNFGRNVWVILSPDGNGGYVVSFGQ